MTQSAAPRKLTLRTLHRLIGSVVAVFLLYIGVTGVILQTVDLRALLTHASAGDPDIQAIRESLDGPSSFSVIDTADYDAGPLPSVFLSGDEILRLTKAARAQSSVPVRYVELRMIGDRPVGQVMTDHLLRFDAQNLSPLPLPPAPRPHGQPRSAHLLVKQWHRTWALGDGMLWANALMGIALGVMVVTGIMQYVHMLRARMRMDKKALFWSAGGVWRAWHRSLALVAALFLGVVAISGTLLSVDSFSLQVYRWIHPDKLMFGFVPVGMVGDYSRPLNDAQLPAMLNTTLTGYRHIAGERPVKVVRLRYFASMPQGVVIAGGNTTRQFVFNAKTGARVSSSEPGYPYMGFPFGWREHELMKQIHRGDILGVPGRIIDLLAGLALIYLSVSGLWMSIDLSRRRAKSRK